MSLFATLDDDANVKPEQDTLGGGGFLVESGVYDFTIEMAFAEKSQGGALGVTLHLKDDASGALVRVTEYVTSGDAKGNSNTYIDKKSGEKRFLPGYSKMDSMTKLAAGLDLKSVTHETKVINRWDFQASKEMPTKTEVMTDLIGKPITAGVIKQTVDKNVKDNASGQYVPSGETRDENVIDKFFRTRDRLTTTEIIAGATESAFIDQWSEKNTGVTRNLAKGASATPGAASGAQSGAPLAAGEKPASLFG